MLDGVKVRDRLIDTAGRWPAAMVMRFDHVDSSISGMGMQHNRFDRSAILLMRV
jgi:hypothetical protein